MSENYEDCDYGLDLDVVAIVYQSRVFISSEGGSGN